MRNDGPKDSIQEVISMEEYLDKRQRIKEEQKKKKRRMQEKSPAWMWAELYV